MKSPSFEAFLVPATSLAQPMCTSQSRIYFDRTYSPVGGNRPETVKSSLGTYNFYKDGKTGQKQDVQSLCIVQKHLEGVTLAHPPNTTPENRKKGNKPMQDCVLAFRAAGTCVLLVSLPGTTKSRGWGIRQTVYPHRCGSLCESPALKSGEH